MTDRVTLQDHLGAEDTGHALCDACRRRKRTFELVEVQDDDGLAGPFVCGACLIDTKRVSLLGADGRPPIGWEDVRAARTLMLSRTDWVMAEDVPQSHKVRLQPLRTKLRDITKTEASPRSALNRLHKLAVEYINGLQGE